MDTALTALIEISHAVGKDRSLVLGNYGNTSVKSSDGATMVIKASGAELSRVNAQSGWRRVRVADVLALLHDKQLAKRPEADRTARLDAALLLACQDEQPASLKPSIETFFHALLDTVVIHLHPEAVLAAACSKNGPQIVARMFANEKFPPLWIPYAGLGYPSARKIQTLAAGYKSAYGRNPQVMIMQNHGLLVSAATPAAAMHLVKKTVAVCAAKQIRPGHIRTKTADLTAITAAQSALRQAIFNAGSGYTCIRALTDSAVLSALAGTGGKALSGGGAITPDEAAVTHGGPLWVEQLNPARLTAQLETIKRAEKPLPVGFAVKGLGLFTATLVRQADFTADFFRSYLGVRRNAVRFGGLRFIPPSKVAQYAEHKPSTAPSSPLSGRMAIVTGAGSGLGRSIAIGLARAGANVALADIDAAGAAETAQHIAAECPQTTTLAVECNVTSEQSVENAFSALMTEWGGLDILVNAAGVAPAYSLLELPVDKWRFALEVNLTGYFLMARAAARIMTVQAIGGSIINISSKSGLDPSKNNTPYNATKAGELHMARGWALELGPHNIRVNSVCPGNVFEGSKIWNPDYMRICAKKYGIKPDEVIPYYVSKTALNREIKGQDIADSVVFLASDQARRITGQTLVTDAGQVYVR